MVLALDTNPHRITRSLSDIGKRISELDQVATSLETQRNFPRKHCATRSGGASVGSLVEPGIPIKAKLWKEQKFAELQAHEAKAEAAEHMSLCSRIQEMVTNKSTQYWNKFRASAQCSPVISYIPVTHTVTSYVTPTVTVTETASIPVQPETFTSTSTHYVTIEVSENTASATTTGLFSYVVQSGTTSWFGSVAPSSGQSLVYVTTTVYVQPTPSTVTSTLDTITVSPPPYVSTTYSAPDSDVTSTLTTTRTSTTTLSTVITQIRSSFTPIGSLGWNSTTTDVNGPTAYSLSSGTGIPTTITGTVYWSSGNQITSTSYNTITTTLTESIQLTTTITPTETDTISTGTTSGGSAETTSASSSVAVGASTAAASSSLGPSSLASSSSSGFIPSSFSITSTYGIVPETYGGYGGFSTIASIGSASSASPVSSTISSSAVPSLPSSSQTGAASSSAVVSPLTQSSATSSTSPVSYTAPTSLISSSGTSSIAAGSSSTVLSAASSVVTSSAVTLSRSTSASGSTSPAASSSTAQSSGISVTSTAPVASSSTPAGVSAASSLGVSSAVSSVLSSTSIASISSSGISYSGTSSAVTSLLVSSSTASSALASSSQSSVVSGPLTVSSSRTQPLTVSSSSTIPAVPTTSGPAVYGLPPSSSAAVSPITATSQPGQYGIPSASSSQAAVSSSVISSISFSTVTDLAPSASPVLSSSVSVTVSSTVSSASATPSVCGEHGNFTLNFDDLPNFSTGNNTDITQAPPIFNGYHHFAFSDGYVYAPPPSDPFPPTSAPHLAVFLGNASGSGLNNTPSAMAPTSGFIRPGEFGDGSSAAQSAFWFNIYSAWLGCDTSGPEVCTYVLTAYTFDAASQSEQQLATTNATTTPCPGFQNCHLEQVTFPSTFQGLSGVQIQAYKGQDQVMFFMDDVSMGWYNNTCAAGLQRLRSPRGGAVARR